MRQFAIFHYNEYLFKVGASTTDGALDVARDRMRAKIEAFNDVERGKAGGNKDYKFQQPPFKMPNRAEVIEIPGLGGEMLPWQQQLKKQQIEAQHELAALIAEKEAQPVAPPPVSIPAVAEHHPVVEHPPVVEGPNSAVVIGGEHEI